MIKERRALDEKLREQLTPDEIAVLLGLLKRIAEFEF